VLGDSLRPETRSFDHGSSVSVLAKFPVRALGRRIAINIVPAITVGKAIVSIHQRGGTTLSAHITFLQHWIRKLTAN